MHNVILEEGTIGILPSIYTSRANLRTLVIRKANI